MGLLLRELEHELARYVVIYRSSRSTQAAFARYAELHDLRAALREDASPADRMDLIAALVEAQRTRPQRLWQVLLVVACGPMLKRLRARVRAESREDIGHRILLAFLEAVGEVGAQRGDRVVMRLRQMTARLLFRSLRNESLHRQLEREAGELTHGRPPRPPDEDRPHELLPPRDRASRRLLGTAGDHGKLRAYARACARRSGSALGRVYRRLQQRRRRLLRQLRSQSRAA
jgi:hypothetical protein